MFKLGHAHTFSSEGPLNQLHEDEWRVNPEAAKPAQKEKVKLPTYIGGTSGGKTKQTNKKTVTMEEA